jgi:hypothetical protein
MQKGVGTEAVGAFPQFQSPASVGDIVTVAGQFIALQQPEILRDAGHRGGTVFVRPFRRSDFTYDHGAISGMAGVVSSQVTQFSISVRPDERKGV